MVKLNWFSKNSTTETSTEAVQGVTSRGDSLRRSWLAALGIALVPILLVSAYLVTVREVQLRDQKVEDLATTWTQLQAVQVKNLFNGLQDRLEAAATAPTAVSAVISGAAAEGQRAEQLLRHFFPEAAGVRLIVLGPLGTAGLDTQSLALRNHIELDQVRRAADDQPARLESYLAEGQWLTSLAVPVASDGEAGRGVLLATFDNQLVQQALRDRSGAIGRSVLQQLHGDGPGAIVSDIAAAGEGDRKAYQVVHRFNGNRWQLQFTPSDATVKSLTPPLNPLLVILGVIALSVIAALVFVLRRFRSLLGQEVDRINTAVEKRSPLAVGIPQLLPLARALNREAMRNRVQSPTAETPAEAEKPAPASPVSNLIDPMFQRKQMIVEEEEAENGEPHQSEAPPPMSEEEASTFPEHIFRAYDIRGFAESELTDGLVARIGAAIGTLAGQRDQQAIIVACDGRNSSPRIKTSLIKSLLASGRDVVDIGVVPTPLLYFATHTRESRSGVMITGSHNPADYNGLKIVIDGHTLAGQEIQDLKKIVLREKFSEGVGRLHKSDVREEYINAIISDMAIAVPLKVVVDAGNGVAGNIAPDLLEFLGCEVVRLYCEVDGNFPNHHPDTSNEANLADLCERVVAEKANFGVAFDGDGDRLAIVTAEGNIVRTDTLMMLYAQDVVSRNPGADVVFDVKCTRHLAQVVSRCGGRPVPWKTGHSFMREKVRETGALLGGEFSGHIFFAERWYGFDDGLYACARLAEILSTSQTGLAELLAEFPVAHSTPEILIPVAENEKFDLVRQLAEEGAFAEGKLNTLDGVRVDYGDGWGLVRASNTVPALTARFEGDSEAALDRIRDAFREQLAAVEPGLDPGF
jgi:phosphomannomutase/phosphoglucomutase